MLPAAQAYGMAFLPYSPLGGGALGGTAGRTTTAAGATSSDQTSDKLEAFEALCEKLGHAPGDVALAWLAPAPASPPRSSARARWRSWTPAWPRWRSGSTRRHLKRARRRCSPAPAGRRRKPTHGDKDGRNTPEAVSRRVDEGKDRTMRIPDAKLAEIWDRGFTVVESFLDPDTLAAAQDALWEIYPRARGLFRRSRAPIPKFAKSQFAGLRLFPYPLVGAEPRAGLSGPDRRGRAVPADQGDRLLQDRALGEVRRRDRLRPDASPRLREPHHRRAARRRA